MPTERAAPFSVPEAVRPAERGGAAARVAIVGWQLESNSLAPASGESEFASRHLRWGEALWDHPDLAARFGPGASLAFGARLTRLRPWEPIPVGYCDAGAGGPCEQRFFAHLVDEMLRRLRVALPVDAVLICGHGAGTMTDGDDMDGPLYAAIRAVVSANVPIVAVLDLHAKLSSQMVASVDALVGYRTNPHVDVDARYAEAADVLHALLEGRPLATCWIRVPLLTPQVAQLTERGQPVGDLFALAQELGENDVVNVSIFPGFALGDTPHNGLSILVASTERARAERLCTQLAVRAWEDRERYRRTLVGVDEAVGIAARACKGASAAPVILADVADNPGGGGRGNTLWLIEACRRAGLHGVLAGVIYDPPLVEQARAHGAGSRFEARFNTAEPSPYSRPLDVEATVLRLSDGRFRGRLGMARDCEVDLGPSCALDIGGIAVVVSSIRQQLLAADWLEHFGLEPARAGAILVKSRGHFRAGFAHLVPPERILEVDAPGLTTPNLALVAWRRLARPIYPLDPGIEWRPQPMLSKIACFERWGSRT